MLTKHCLFIFQLKRYNVIIVLFPMTSRPGDLLTLGLT